MNQYSCVLYTVLHYWNIINEMCSTLIWWCIFHLCSIFQNDLGIVSGNNSLVIINLEYKLWELLVDVFSVYIGKDGNKVTTVVATPGQGLDHPSEVSYTDTKVIGNGSFGVVYQAKLCDTNEMVAIKKVLQDKRFKVGIWKFIYNIILYYFVI